MNEQTLQGVHTILFIETTSGVKLKLLYVLSLQLTMSL